MEETTPGDTLPVLSNDTGGPAQVVFAEGEADIAAGQVLYQQTCLPCHGDDGMGGHNNALPLNNLTDIRDAVNCGVLRQKCHAEFHRGALTPEQIRDVSGYVVGWIISVTIQS